MSNSTLILTTQVTLSDRKGCLLTAHLTRKASGPSLHTFISIVEVQYFPYFPGESQLPLVEGNLPTGICLWNLL